jgi:hypothetical protein
MIPVALDNHHCGNGTGHQDLMCNNWKELHVEKWPDPGPNQQLCCALFHIHTVTGRGLRAAGPRPGTIMIDICEIVWMNYDVSFMDFNLFKTEFSDSERRYHCTVTNLNGMT